MKKYYLVGAVVACSACHNYSAVPLSAIVPGQSVQVDLTESGSSSVASYVGGRARTLEGKVTRVDSAGLQLSVTDLTRSTDLSESWQGEIVAVPAGGIAALNLVKVSAPRSVFAASALVAGAVTLARALGAGTALATKGGTPPPGGH